MALLPTYVATLFFALGCAPRSGAQEIKSSISENITTVVKVHWVTEEPTVGYVEFGASTDYGSRTPLEQEASTQHEATLLGLTSELDVHFRVVVEGSAGDTLSDDHSITTGNLPNDLPSITLSGEGPGGYLGVPMIGSAYASLILNGDGEIVWYHVEDRGPRIIRTMMTADRQSVVYAHLTDLSYEQGEGELVWVDLDGGNTTHVDVEMIHHDFVELPDGAIGCLIQDSRAYTLTDGPQAGSTRYATGDTLIEVNRDGETTEIWTVWDHFDPMDEDYVSPDDGSGWSHANALDYDADDDAYYVSLRNFGSIVKVDRATGDILWGLAGLANTFDMDRDTVPFRVQHQFDLTDKGIVVFDNGLEPSTPSRVVEYRLNVENGTANEIWSYTSEDELKVFALGDVHRYDDGETLVTWSTSGELQLVDVQGEVNWQLNTELGYAFGYVWPFQGLYAPP